MDDVGRVAVPLLLDAAAHGKVVMLPTRLRFAESCGASIADRAG